MKQKLQNIFDDEELLSLLFKIIDSYEKTPNKGLPLGNQTSQWFAIYYLDSFDRLIKEKLRIKYYSRYMDDSILLCDNKDYLRYCFESMKKYLGDVLRLEFNAKTQITPFKNGVNYLGFRFYLTENGKVVKKLKKQTKLKFKRRLKFMKEQFCEGKLSIEEIRQVIVSYIAHFKHGNTYWLLEENLNETIFQH